MFWKENVQVFPSGVYEAELHRCNWIFPFCNEMPTVFVFILALGLFPHASKTNGDNMSNAHEKLLVADKQCRCCHDRDYWSCFFTIVITIPEFPWDYVAWGQKYFKPAHTKQSACDRARLWLNRRTAEILEPEGNSGRNENTTMTGIIPGVSNNWRINTSKGKRRERGLKCLSSLSSLTASVRAIRSKYTGFVSQLLI